MFINGQRIVRGNMIDVISPYSNKVVGQVAAAQDEDIDRIMAAAEEGARIMRKMPAGERAKILEKAAQKLSESEEMAQLLVAEVGKTIREARGEISRGANTLKLSADACRGLSGKTVRFDLLSDTNKIGFYQRVPIGIVLAITPFNFPINLACHKIGPAIAAGNAIIVKPATKTPLATIRLAEILVECGLPACAISVVCGHGNVVGDKLVQNPSIRKISFTGSPEIGKRITKTAGLKKVTMELGSNAAVVIMPDACLNVAAKKIRVGGFSVAGQVCISVQRVFVHEKVFDGFLKTLCNEVGKIKMGDPSKEDTDLGPMISEDSAKRAASWIEEAVAAGARLVCGGRRDGAMLEPTILADVPQNCKVMTEEIFAPVIAVNRFSTLDEAIEMVNGSKYGLQASIFSNDINNVLQFIEMVDAGTVLANETTNFRVDNMPYGGVKESGIGREGPAFAVEEMTELKLVILDRAGN